MMTYDELYSYKETINNLRLIKLAIDAGADQGAFSDFRADPYFGLEPARNIFQEAVQELFEVWEFYNPYDDYDKSVIDKNKEYWASLAGYQLVGDYDNYGMIVILDDRIPLRDNLKKIDPSVEVEHLQFGGIVDITLIDHGFVILYDYDYGMPDCTEALSSLLRYMRVFEEAKKDEMDI